jgi:hypothetical protein
MMLRRISYESETVLPEEVSKAFQKAEERICENKYEIDKIILHLAWLKSECMQWFNSHKALTREA